MTIRTLVAAALNSVEPNSWAVELPDRPEWPAIVFEIESIPEDGWVAGVGYDQDVVTVVILDRDLDNVDAIKLQVREAMSVIEGYMGDEEHGDSAYEGEPNVYGYFMNFRFRSRR